MINSSSLRGSLTAGKRLAIRIYHLPLLARALGLLALVGVLLSTAAAASRKASRNSAVYTVTATAYEAVAGQTDSKPFITADNSRIPRGYGSHTRWLALSRDLLRPWGGPFEFGDKVRVRGVSRRFDGVYTVHDTMNRRYRHRLDLLVHPRERISINQPGVQLQRLSRQPSSVAARKAPRKLAHASKASRRAHAPRKTVLLAKHKPNKRAPAPRKRALLARHKPSKRARAPRNKVLLARHKSSIKKARS